MRTGNRFALIVLAVVLIGTSALVAFESGSARAAHVGARAPGTRTRPNAFSTLGGTLYFVAHDGTHGSELWKSDGTAAGTVMVRDIARGSKGSNPSDLTDVGGTLYFAASDRVHGRELWKSDGTTAGTVMVRDIHPGSAGSYPQGLADVGVTLYFSADDGTHGRELWESRGTAAGTVMANDIWAGAESSGPDSLTDVGGILYFTASDGISGHELWKTDGTAAGTVLVKDTNPHGLNGFFSFPPLEWLTDVGGTLYFAANDGTHGEELWKSDGTTRGTFMVRDINAGPPGHTTNSFPAWLTGVGDALYFVASDDPHGQELWKSDGTGAGTVMVKDIRPGSNQGGSHSQSLTVVEGTLYFTATDGTHGDELWRSDGTEAVTVMIKDINPGSGLSPFPQSLIRVGGTLYFSADDGTHGYELWKSDGTVAGTVMVKDIWPGSEGSGSVGSEGSRAFPLIAAGGILGFTANDGTHGQELWTSDGTATGTAIVRDIMPGSTSSKPSDFVYVPG